MHMQMIPKTTIFEKIRKYRPPMRLAVATMVLNTVGLECPSQQTMFHSVEYGEDIPLKKKKP